MLKLNQEQIDAIQNSCLDESTKLIRYLEVERRKRKYDWAINFLIGLSGAVVGAVLSYVLPKILG